MTFRLVSALLLAAGLTASAQGPSRAAIQGPGTATCAQWFAAMKGASADPLQVSWAQGYFSGVSVWTTPLNMELPPAQVKAFVDGFCRTNPALPIAAAAEAMVKQHRLMNPPPKKPA